MNTTGILFRDEEHKRFFIEKMKKYREDDFNYDYLRTFFYLIGISNDTRKHIDELFDDMEGRPQRDVLHAEWQTSNSARVCRLAFNLWNGYAEEGEEKYFSPYWLFDCSYGPFFWEGIKLLFSYDCNNEL